MADALAEFLPELNILREEPKTPEAETLPEIPAEENAEEQAESSEPEVTETESADEAETEEETEAEEETEEDRRKRTWPESAQRRVAKLTAKLREAEERETVKAEEVEALRAQLTEATTKANQATVQATKSGALENVWSENDLLTEAQKALAWKQWAIEHPEGGSVKVGDGEREYGAEEVERIKINADRILGVEIPKRKAFLQQAAQVESQLAAVFPSYFDPKAEDYKAAMGALHEMPELKSRPDGMAIAIALSIGLRQMTAQQQEKKKASSKPAAPATKPKLAPPPVEPGGGPRTVAPSKSDATKRSKSVESVIAQAGDVDALTNFFNQ